MKKANYSKMSAPLAGSLTDAALKRKERIEQLKAAKRAKTDIENNASGNTTELPKPMFRSYKPVTDTLRESVLPEAAPGEVADHVREELDNEHRGVEIEQLDFTNLAPRKPDWDLKRDIAPRLEKLERRTQRAIAELIRERLREEDLANAVTAGASRARATATDDEEN